MIRAVFSLIFACSFSACPAPAVDLTYPYDVTPFDATPGDGALRNPSGFPSCAPEAVIDVNAVALRSGTTLTLSVDTRFAPNDIHPGCVIDDGPEVVLRYRVPPADERIVAAIRVSTVTDATRANATSRDGTTVADPTTFDTVLVLRTQCDGRDLDCDNDDFVQGALGAAVSTRRSTVWQLDPMPEDEILIVLDGNESSRGIALVTIEEIPQLGVLGAPCADVPPSRALDPTAPTARFRCPEPGVQCRPGAAADGTDLCLPIVALGAACDDQGRFNVCERDSEGAACASNPSDETQVACAMPGNAAGAPCRGTRATIDRCNSGLFCSETMPGEGTDTCVPIRHTGESCDPSPFGEINHCDTGLSCCVMGLATLGETSCQPTGCVAPPAM